MKIILQLIKIKHNPLKKKRIIKRTRLLNLTKKKRGNVVTWRLKVDVLCSRRINLPAWSHGEDKINDER